MSYYKNNLEDGCLAILLLPLYGLWQLIKWIGKGLLYVLGGIVYIPYILFIEPVEKVIKGEQKPNKGCLIMLGIFVVLILWCIVANKLGI